MDLCLEHAPGYWVTQEERAQIIEVPKGYQVTKIKLQNSDLWTIIESGPTFEFMNINDIVLFNKLFVDTFKKGQLRTISDISMFFKNIDYICMRSIEFCKCEFYLEHKTYKNNGVIRMDVSHPCIIGFIHSLKGDYRDIYDSVFEREGQKITMVQIDGERFYFQYFTNTLKETQKKVKKLLKDQDMSDINFNVPFQDLCNTILSSNSFRKITPICIKYPKS